MRFSLLFSALVVLAGSTGCSTPYLFRGGRPQETMIPHPAKADPSAYGALTYTNESIEQQRGLPMGSLTQEVRLVQANPQGVCFNIVLRGLDRRYPDLRNWNILYRSSDGIEDNSPQVQLVEAQTQTFNGLVPTEIQDGTQTVCTAQDNYNQCVRWEEQPISHIEYVPGPVEVSMGGGTACFPNTEHLTLATTAIALRLNAGRMLGGGTVWGIGVNASEDLMRLTFQWDFEPGTAGGTAVASN